MKLEQKELLMIWGGAAWSAALVNAIVKSFQFIYDLGRSVGSSISRAISKKFC